VLAWWLSERTAPATRITRARVRTLSRASGGDRRTLNRLIHFDIGTNKPARHRSEWAGLTVTHYIGLRLFDYMAERGNHA